jgi:hypothetical protein
MKMLMITEMCIFRKHLDISKIFLSDEVTKHIHKYTETHKHTYIDMKHRSSETKVPTGSQISSLCPFPFRSRPWG